jgi:hypothetical protein
MADRDELAALRAENTRLIALFESQGIEWRLPSRPAPPPVDEYQHIGAVSFDAILKRTRAEYVLGLTATPIRRYGQQPIIFMQCGSIRHTAA